MSYFVLSEDVLSLRDSHSAVCGPQQAFQRSKQVIKGKTVESKNKGRVTKTQKATDIVYMRVSSSKQQDRSGFKQQALRRCSGQDSQGVYLPNSHALARSTLAGEPVYELPKKHGVDILSSDVPDLFTHGCISAE